MIHQPVLTQEVSQYWHHKKGGFYVDATLGTGGHSLILLNHDPNARLLGIDRDGNVLSIAEERLKHFKNRITLIHSNFTDLPAILQKYGFPKADGILLDLGVSSIQLDDAKRGFSFNKVGPFDMRMDPTQIETAEILLKKLDTEELAKLIRTYGEEPHASRISKELKKLSMSQKHLTTIQCAKIISDIIPSQRGVKKIHPATKTFQAFRIAVNQEIQNIQKLMSQIPSLIQTKGRIVVISFHSLEDRIIKRTMNLWQKGCVCPSDFPKCVCGIIPEFKILTKKAVRPSLNEIKQNPRSRSAKLRSAEKCR